MTDEAGRDPIETLLARLERAEPPPDFVARVLARAQQSEVAAWPRWRRALFGAGYVGALALLALLAFFTGIEFERSGLRDLLSLTVRDLSAVTDAPGVYLVALRDAIPWLHLLAVVADLLLVALATRLLLRVATPPSERRPARA